MPSRKWFENGKEVRIGQADVLAVNEKGQLVSKGKQPTMPTNVKGMTPGQLGQELGELVNRVTARGTSFSPQELARYEALNAEANAKANIANLAKAAEMRRIGISMRREKNQKRLDAQSPRYKGVISRSNSGSQVDRSDAIKERHAKLRTR